MFGMLQYLDINVIFKVIYTDSLGRDLLCIIFHTMDFGVIRLSQDIGMRFSISFLDVFGPFDSS